MNPGMTFAVATDPIEVSEGGDGNNAAIIALAAIGGIAFVALVAVVMYRRMNKGTTSSPRDLDKSEVSADVVQIQMQRQHARS